MKIVSITWARNEVDILESFVRHNASIVDRMVIVLHRTKDNSSTILEMLREEGMAIDIRTEEHPLHHQTEVLTALMHDLAQNDAPDWILPLDADEFLISPENADPREKLEKLDRTTPHLLCWRTYVPTERDSPTEPDPVRRIIFRKSCEEPPFSKVLIPGTLAADDNVCLAPGNHSILRHTPEGKIPVSAMPASHLALAHFPVRSESQLRRKILQGWPSVRDLPTRQPREAYHWKQLFPRCSDPAPIGREELQKITMQYSANRDTPVDLTVDPLIRRYARIRYIQQTVPVPVGNATTSPHTRVHQLSASETRDADQYQRFILFCHPRCGSSNLCRILSQHEDIHCASEIFNVGNINMQRYLAATLGMKPTCLENHETMLQDFFFRCHAHEKKSVIGLKILDYQVPEYLQKGWLLQPEHKVILLSRQNMLAAALSIQIAWRTGIYNIRPNEELVLRRPFRVRKEDIEHWMRSQREWLQELRSLLLEHGKPFFECTYEQLGKSTIAELCQFLGCSPLEEYENYFSKITQPHHYEYIENLSEILDAFSSEEYVSIPVTPHTKTLSSL